MRLPALASLLLAASFCGACGGSERAEPVTEAPVLTRSLLPESDAPARFERALVAHGAASIVLEARGRGTLVLEATFEGGEPFRLLEFELEDRFRRVETKIPRDGDRALLLSVDGPETVDWHTLALHEPAPGIPEESPLEGSCEGRNVVVFLADSLAARHTTPHGYERETTPGLDQLAADGVRFEAAHSQTSWTMPSVTSLFTAQTQERHGMLRMNQQLPEGVATLAQSFQVAGYKTIGLIQNGIIWSHTRLNRGFDEYDVRNEGNQVTEDLMRKARELMNVPRGRPLFLYVHLTPPHQPYTPPEPYSERFVDPDYGGEVQGSIMDCAKINHFKPPADGPDVQQLQALYDGHIRYVDDLILSTMQEVWQESPREDWVVVVTSDHGEAFLQHGDQGHNTQVYQEMVHIPLVITAPGSPLPAGRTVDTPVSLLDVGPTLRELAGLPAPNQVEDGRSLLPFVDEPKRDWRRPFYFSSRYPKEADGAPRWTAVRLGNWKLLRSDEGLELYDLVNDPFEERDLAVERPIRTAALAALLADWRRGGVRADAASGEIPAEALKELERLGYVDSEGNDVASPDAGD